MSPRFKPRILVLPLAAALIAGLVWYRMHRAPDHSPQIVNRTHLQGQPAPVFTLHDQKSQPFRLGRYLGRHKLLIVFFDPSVGAGQNRQLQVLKSGYDQLTAHGEKVIAISSATPYANRQSFLAGGDFPFHILSDADYSVETQWGVMSAGDPPQVKPSAFVIDRAGVISWSQFSTEPIPVETLLRELKQAR